MTEHEGEGLPVDGEGLAEQIQRRRVGRRRLLQGAAAAGVGVAVWSAPNIKTLGMTPAYAHVCSTVPTNLTGERNVDCSQGACAGGVQYQTPITTGFPAGFSISIVGTNRCSTTAGGIPVTITSPGLDCVVASVTIQTPGGVVVSGPHTSGALFLPEITGLAANDCASNKSVVVLSCVPEGQCHPSTHTH